MSLLPGWICNCGRMAYEPATDLQHTVRDARERGDVPNVILMLEHDPVITTGYRTDPSEVAGARLTDIPVLPTERGGKATYHGPGQIVAYPVIDLADYGNDVRAYVRRLEQSVIDTLSEWGIRATRRSEYPGVWVGDPAGAQPLSKIASLGVRVTRWITSHGVALNVDCDLAPFTSFTPCGIPDVTMTSMSSLLGTDCPSLEQVWDRFADALAMNLDLDTSPVSAAHLQEDRMEVMA